MNMDLLEVSFMSSILNALVFISFTIIAVLAISGLLLGMLAVVLSPSWKIQGDLWGQAGNLSIFDLSCLKFPTNPFPGALDFHPINPDVE